VNGTNVTNVNLTIDGVPVSVPKGTLLVEAAKTVKQEIPVYCYHTKLGPAGLCRVCLVDIEGQPKLQIACNTPVADGMVVRTRGERVEAGRAMILELLLVNHPLDCPICDKGGECDLQDYAMAYARPTSDVVDPKSRKPKAVDLGPTIVLDEERCVVCQRCVRFDDIIADERQLVVKDRGAGDIIATATEYPYSHNFTGNVTELCPVGALTSKTYRFKSRPWDLNRTKTTCTQCPVGCGMFADVRYGTLLRTMSIEDDTVSDGWLCDRGRYNIGFYDSPERVLQPLYKKNGTFVQIGWDDAFALWAKAIRSAHDRLGAGGFGAIGGGRLTNEEAYLLQHVFRGLGTANVDWRAGRQRQATPGKNGGTYEELETAQAIVIAGGSPEELAPVLWLRVRKARLRAGATLINEPDPQRARAALPPGTERVALIWDGVDPVAGRALAAAFADVANVRAYIASEQANARGAEAMGMLPNAGPGFQNDVNGRDYAQMFEHASAGKLDVLSLFGVNPARNAADPQAAIRALRALPFLVVSDLFLTETAELATLVLPAKGPFEKFGSTMNVTGELLDVRPSLEAPAGVLSDLEMLIGLGELMNVGLPTQEALDRAVAESAAVSIDGFSFGTGPFESTQAPAISTQPPRILSGGGTWDHDSTVAQLAPRRDGELVGAVEAG
jgi:NADH-quinone oxidoreductase subunit G